jgi:virginiamycin B lyase
LKKMKRFAWLGIAFGSIALAQTFTEYVVPTTLAAPFGIAVGSDGALWFTENEGNKIGRITTSGVLTEYPLPSSGGSGPSSIAAGPDGALWFVLPAAIGRITTAGVISEYPVPEFVPGPPGGITAGPDGAMWFVAGNSGIGRISTAGATTFYKLPVSGGSPAAIISGPDGNLWFTDGNHSALDRITTAGVVTQFPITQGPVPNTMTVGPDGQIWGMAAPSVASFTTAGAITSSFIAQNAGSGQSLTTGPDGNLWYVNWELGFIDQLTLSQVDTQFQVPTFDSVPYAIVTGPDGAMWFTEHANPGGNSNPGKIGRLTVPPSAPAGPSILTGGIVNAASYAQTSGAGDPVAPGALVAIFTSQLSAQAATFSTQTLPPSLGGVSVSFNGIPAPMVQVVPSGQYPFISAQVPFEVSPGTASVVITVNNTPSAAFQEKIVASQPGIFTIPATGQGNAILVYLNPATNAPAIAAPSGSSITSIPSSPIPRGTNAFFYVTGLGAMTPTVPDGSGTCPASSGICNANATPQVSVGGVSATVAFAGQAPGFPGVFQVNITIPPNAPTGSSVPLVVKSADGSVTSNAATIAVQ